MDWSDEHDKAGPAFFAVLSEVTNPKKNADNPFYHSKYTTLESLKKHVNPTLEKNDFVLSQPLGENQYGRPTVTSILLHKSLQWIRNGPYPIIMEKETPQGEGSGATYGRRQTLSAMLGIVSEDDDDGNAAEPTKRETTKPKVAQVKSDLTAGGCEKQTLYKIDTLLATAGVTDSTAKIKDEKAKAAMHENNKLLTFEYMKKNNILVENELNPLWYAKPKEMSILEETVRAKIEAADK
jgi:hypothetical protein